MGVVEDNRGGVVAEDTEHGCKEQSYGDGPSDEDSFELFSPVELASLLPLFLDVLVIGVLIDEDLEIRDLFLFLLHYWI
jgi:hypothetical protein